MESKHTSGITGIALSRRTALKSMLAAGVLPAWGAQSGSGTLQRHTLQLDAEHQQIDNFSASDCWSMQKIGGWSEPGRKRVADLLFSPTAGIALSCWRFNLGGGINPQITNPWRTAETFETAEGRYDWTHQKNEQWFLKAAKERGVPQFLAFVNSPPGRMTKNGLTFCDKNSGTTNLKPGYEGQYARYLGDILEHFHRGGGPAGQITFDCISPVNEPQWDWEGHSQEGNRASNADIKKITRSLAAELKRRALPTRIALIESGSLPDMWQANQKSTAAWGALYGNYLDEFAGDATISGMLSGQIGYHSYGSDGINGPLTANRKRLGEKMKQYPGWKLWQTEYCILSGPEGKGGNGRDLTMATALDVARVIHFDLTLAGVSAWQWWTAMSPVNFKDGLIYTDWKKPGDAESILPARLLWALGNYSRFVRPGMRRIELAGAAQDVRGLMGSAFKDEKARRVVAVYVNAGEQAVGVLPEFSLGKRPWKLASLTPYVTSDREGDELKAYPAVMPASRVGIPPRSVVTLVAQFAGRS
jgi:O-Glycosyl hydrolase family 30